MQLNRRQFLGSAAAAAALSTAPAVMIFSTLLRTVDKTEGNG